MTSSSATRVAAPTRGAGWAAGYRFRWPPATRRGVQVTLGVLWLVDAVLQLQPFMFTAAFARQVLATAGAGQPAWVAGPVDFFARIVAQHPVPLDAGFALVQFALGIGFLLPRLLRPAIVGSLAWSAGIWWFGEGLGGVASGRASLVTGAPGAVLLYAVLAAAAWPAHQDGAPGQDQKPGAARVAVAGWFPAAWAILWVGAAVLQLDGGPASAAALRDQIDSGDGLPAWLAQAHHLAGLGLRHAGSTPLYVLVTVMALVGLAGLGGRPWRPAAAAVGAVAATIFWVLGQNIGQLYSGMATDPNTGPLIVLMALALAATSAPHRGNHPTRHPHNAHWPLAPIRHGNGNESPSRTVFLRRRIGDDVNISRRVLALVIAVPLVLTGCAATYAIAHPGPAMSMAPGSLMSSGMPMSPGMTMAPGQPMAAMKSRPAAPAVAASVPKSASMTCGPETATNVAMLMGLHTPAPTRATWADHLYTCTYRLPTGTLVLSVKDSPDVAAARGYFTDRRRALGRTQPLSGLDGLGLPAYENTTGSVVFLKDNMTLKVDAAALPGRVGPQGTSRTDLAYTVATDVLACWTGK
jgi:hypothetical protein